MAQETYRVPEVSCEHCVRAITDELSPLPGVQDVRVDLETKEVTVHHDGTANPAQLRAGIVEAGYEVAA